MHVFGPDVVTVMGTLGGLGGGLCGMSMCLSIPLCVITVSFFCALKIPVHYQTEISLCVCEREGERWGGGQKEKKTSSVHALTLQIAIGLKEHCLICFPFRAQLAL